MNKFVALNHNVETFGIIIGSYTEYKNKIFTIRIIKTDSKIRSVNDFITCYEWEFQIITDKKTINMLNKVVTFL